MVKRAFSDEDDGIGNGHTGHSVAVLEGVGHDDAGSLGDVTAGYAGGGGGDQNDEGVFLVAEEESGAFTVVGQILTVLECVLSRRNNAVGDGDGRKLGASVSPCWMLHKDYQGKGYAFEAAQAFFDHLFRDKGIRRIYAYTEDYNLSCQRLCEKLGMRREGLFLEFVSFVNNPDGTPLYENTFQYAILKKEWLARK